MPPAETEVRCCIAGGGPAGMMLGYLLARAGVDVLVLEKHADFLRDFRGDTIHPSTLQVLHELGLLDALLRLPHQAVTELSAEIGDETFPAADFTHLPTAMRAIVFMPQWDLLDFLARQGGRYRGFGLRMRAEVTELVEEAGRVVGLRASTPDGPLTVRADLVVGADGRHSTVRARAGLRPVETGAPMDVLWFSLPRRGDDPPGTAGRFAPRAVLIRINRGEHWQCGLVIPKGAAEQVRAGGLTAFRATVAQLVPFATDRLDALASWDDVKTLTVGVDHLKTWYRPGLLCIGDAAHTMSPVGGVGINLAIQDAVATANLLSEGLRQGRVSEADLRRVQLRRAWPARLTQHLQVLIQNRVISRVLGGATMRPPLALRALRRLPWLRRLPARIIGMGFRPEHVGHALRQNSTPAAEPAA